MEHSFNVFPEIFLERREHATDPIEACTVTLARPIMTSLQDGHFTCLNHGLMQQLGTIGQAFYMRLFFHFAHLYDGHHQKRLTFMKRYDDICAEWLGGLAVRPYQSIIERDQLGPHLRQLVRAGFLASYTLTQAKGREGFVIAFRPGSAFFADYDRFYRHRERATIQVDFERDQQAIAEPLKVAYLFVEKRHGRPQDGIPYVSSKDVETAKYLLKHGSVHRHRGLLRLCVRGGSQDPVRRTDTERPQTVPHRLPHRPAAPCHRTRQPVGTGSTGARNERPDGIRPVPTRYGGQSLRFTQCPRTGGHRSRGKRRSPGQEPGRWIAGKDHVGYRTRPDHRRATPSPGPVV